MRTDPRIANVTPSAALGRAFIVEEALMSHTAMPVHRPLQPALLAGAALLCAGAWLTKFMVILLHGGSAGIEDLAGVLFVAGAIGLAVATSVAAWRVTSRHRSMVRWMAVAVMLLAVAIANTAVEEGLTALLSPADDSAADELGLVVFGLPALIGGLVTLRKRDELRPRRGS